MVDAWVDLLVNAGMATIGFLLVVMPPIILSIAAEAKKANSKDTPEQGE